MILVQGNEDLARHHAEETVIRQRIPLEGPWERLLALGFVPDDVIEGDVPFRYAVLPAGWRAEGADEDGITFLTDARGFRRVGIVDREVDGHRNVFLTFVNVGYDLADLFINFEGQIAPVLPAQWSLLDEAERIEFFRRVKELSREHRRKWRRAEIFVALAQDDDGVAAWATENAQ